MKKTTKNLLLCSMFFMLSACSGFFDKDNTPNPSPLVNFTPEAKIATRYYTKTSNGVGKDYIKLGPAIYHDSIFTADKDGKVTASFLATGKTKWQVNLRKSISAGVAADDNIVVVGTHDGGVIALNAETGVQIFNVKASSEILASPAIHNDVILVKAIDGKISAFAKDDGRLLWAYEQTEPSLILRGASTPAVQNNMAVAGFANGNLAKLTIQGGSLQWQATIAHPQGSFAIERMIDIDADPVISDNRVFAATYQGHIVSLDYLTGRDIWAHDISSYTGMTVDDERVYISDAKSALWAFNRESGAVNWRQVDLGARNITAPVIVGKYLVVGDSEGFLHWLSREDGHFVARIRMNSSRILATPVVSNGILYVVSTDGHLAAYSVV